MFFFVFFFVFTKYLLSNFFEFIFEGVKKNEYFKNSFFIFHPSSQGSINQTTEPYEISTLARFPKIFSTRKKKFTFLTFKMPLIATPWHFIFVSPVFQLFSFFVCLSHTNHFYFKLQFFIFHFFFLLIGASSQRIYNDYSPRVSSQRFFHSF